MLLQRQYMDVSWEAVFNPGGATDFFKHGMPGPIETREDRFSPTNAWWLSELSRLVYRRGEEEPGITPSGPRRQDFLARVGLEERAFFNAGGVQAAFITRTRDDMPAVGILVFRGTTGTWRNWQSNLSLWWSSWPRGGRVHSGFKRQFMALWPAIACTVTAWHAPLLYTGHSLGGAKCAYFASKSKRRDLAGLALLSAIPAIWAIMNASTPSAEPVNSKLSIMASTCASNSALR